MSIPFGVWTVINCPWGGLMFTSLPIPNPLTDQLLNYPVAEEEGKYTGKGKDPPENCFWRFGYLTFLTK